MSVLNQMFNAESCAVIMGENDAINRCLVGDIEKQYGHCAAGGSHGNGVFFIQRIVDDKPGYALRKQVVYRGFTRLNATALDHGYHHAGAGLVGAAFYGGHNLRGSMQSKIRCGYTNQRRLLACQLLCDAVRNVIELRHRGLNFLPGFCGNVAGLIYDA